MWNTLHTPNDKCTHRNNFFGAIKTIKFWTLILDGFGGVWKSRSNYFHFSAFCNQVFRFQVSTYSYIVFGFTG